MHDDIAWMAATEMADAARAKKLSPVEIAGALLERIDRINPAINAYVLVTHDLAMRQAKDAEAAVMRGDATGVLHGVPVSIKDLFDVDGLPTTKGSLIYKDKIASGYEYSVKRLLDAGAVHLGKTNTPEFGFIAQTQNLLFGATYNPWDISRTPGGSSGGSGAQVAAGLGPLALGSDGGGSIRIPAAFCGIFGLKATYGRVPRNAGGWSTMTHRGPMTRTVSDAALMLDVIAGHEPRDPYSVRTQARSFLEGLDDGIAGARVAWSPDLGFAAVEPEVRAACERAARRFADLGCAVEEASPGFGPQSETFLRIAASADAVWIGELTEEQRAQLDQPAHFFYEYGRGVSGADLVRAQRDRMQLWHTMRAFHERYDLLLTPVTSCTAFRVGEEPKQIGGQDIPPAGWMQFTQPFNLTGQPAASVPCGFDAKGLPVGLHVVGRAYEDALLLRACRAFEQLAPWADKHPDVAAYAAA